eukprot:Phypoly_transcript_00322.p1 GENE.Phypoly_transcript_00322~~Phypoly_transcript_00322.p1  ORF type:complete len:780 (+),score=113.21 Phypoly_transcript_00322:2922-5261(+)
MPIVYAQVVGTSEEQDTHPSLLICVEDLRLLFNAGEGIQRLSNEHGIKLSKINHLFLTSLSWPNWGGAPDLMFYFSDSGKKGLNVYGPTSVQDFVLINHYYFWKPEFLIGVHELSDKSVLNYPSKGVFVKPILITPKNFIPVQSTRIKNPCYEDVIAMRNQIEEEEALGISDSHDVHLPPEDEEEAEEGPRSPNAGPPKGFRISPHHENVKSSLLSLAINRPKFINTPKIDHAVVCYCVHTPEIAGKFDMAAATKLGVPKGPMCGKLVKGETIELPNGKKVSPEDCVGPATPGPIVLVVACPTLDYVENLTTHPSFEPYIADAKNGRIIYVYHITPDDVINSEQYQAWTKKFNGSKTQHIVLHQSSSLKTQESTKESFYSGYKASLAMQMQLNKIDKEFFTLPHQVVANSALPPPMIRAEYLMKTVLQPIASAGFDRSEVPTPVKFAEIPVSPELNQLLTDYNTKLAHGKHHGEIPEYLKNLTREEAEIVFLGTGAAIPFKLRSVTALFVNFFARGGLLIDAGESAYTQLCRKYGEKIDDILINLKCIWISHKHADHHLSLPSILLHRQKALVRAKKEITPVTIFAPYYTSGYLEEFSWFHPLQFRMFHNSEIKSESHNHNDFFKETFGLTSFFNIRVPHIVDSYGLIFQSENGWKLVFSGDTAPCERLAEAGKGATLVIHEATMANDLQHEAAARGHSSTKDAIDIGNKMGCYRTILTHFSARHHHFPVPDFVLKPHHHENVMVAFDLMTVNLKDLPHLPMVIHPLVQMYKEDIAQNK